MLARATTSPKRNLERDEVRGGVSKTSRHRVQAGHDPGGIRVFVTESIHLELKDRGIEGGGSDEDISSFKLRHTSQARTFGNGT